MSLTFTITFEWSHFFRAVEYQYMRLQMGKLALRYNSDLCCPPRHVPLCSCALRNCYTVHWRTCTRALWATHVLYTWFPWL